MLLLSRRPRPALQVTPESAVTRAYDEFGRRLHLFASILTDDSELAQQLVIQAMLPTTWPRTKPIDRNTPIWRRPWRRAASSEWI